MPEPPPDPAPLPLSPLIAERLQWVQRYETSGNQEETCQHFGISKQTLYKWVRRYKQFGLEGLKGGAIEKRRSRLNGPRPKERTAVTLDAEVADRLAIEPNKSALVNQLLRHHYGLDD